MQGHLRYKNSLRHKNPEVGNPHLVLNLYHRVDVQREGLVCTLTLYNRGYSSLRTHTAHRKVLCS